MPIVILNKTYTDLFGTSRSYYLSNAGDQQLLSVELKENISVQSSASVNFQLDPINYIIQWLGGNFEDEGFRVGDVVDVNIYDQYGALLNSYSVNATLVNGSQLGISSLLGWFNATLGEICVLTVRNRERQGMRLNVNHVGNGSTGNEYSLIDGEATTFIFDMSGGGGFYVGTPVGHRSGQFEVVAVLTLTSSNAYDRYYTLDLRVIQSGIYDQNWFNFSGCLKVYLKMAWQSLVGEPFSNLVNVVSNDADTGWYDEGFNQGIIDATLVQGITAIDYTTVSSGQFVIDSASTQYGFGCAYISSDDNYYKNNNYTQSELSMVIYTQIPTGPPFLSATNPLGASYTFEITGISSVGTIHTIDYTFTPSTAFTSFIESLPEQDRLFYVWARYGNVNVLVFADQLTKQVAVGGPLNMLVTDYFDHSQNLDDSTSLVTGYEANVEDDLAFVGKFRIPLTVPCTNLRARIEAYETVTNDKFTLQETVFDIASVPQVGGKYILNEIAPIFTQFQTTSEKINAELMLDSTLDTTGEYGVRLYFPFLYRWEYWLDQANANNDFYPNQQTKNWVPYGTTGNWVLRVYVELVQDDLAYTYDDKIIIKDYDSDPNILQDIELYVDATNQQVNVVTEGELMRVVATHTLVDGSLWQQNDVWGMITVEPTESSPRYWSSTVIPYDLNSLNPLSPLTGLFCDLTFPLPNIARLECYFDPEKVNLNNGVKFTTKIKGCYEVGLKAKYDTFGRIKTTTSGQAKMIS